MQFQVYLDTEGKYRWRLIASNGRTVADSAEGYTRKYDCFRAIEAVCRGVEMAGADAMLQQARGLDMSWIEELASEEQLVTVKGWMLTLLRDTADVAGITSPFNVRTRIRYSVFSRTSYGASNEPFFLYGVTVNRRNRLSKGNQIYYIAIADPHEDYKPHAIEREVGWDRNKTSKDREVIADWFGRRLLGYCLNKSISLEELYKRLHEAEEY